MPRRTRACARAHCGTTHVDGFNGAQCAIEKDGMQHASQHLLQLVLVDFLWPCKYSGAHRDACDGDRGTRMVRSGGSRESGGNGVVGMRIRCAGCVCKQHDVLHVLIGDGPWWLMRRVGRCGAATKCLLRRCSMT